MATTQSNNTEDVVPVDEEVNTAMSTKEFKAEIKRLISEFDNVLDLCAKVALLPRGKTYEIEHDGKIDRIGRREFNQARSQYLSLMNNLGKLYAQARKPKKRTGARRPGTGFRIPIRVSENLSNFFREADLGPVDPRDPKSPPLKDKLELLIKHQITSAALLTPLFSIYAIVNRLTEKAAANHCDGDRNKPLLSPDQMNLQLLGADELMFKHFGETFRILTSRGEHYTDKGTLVEAFNPHNFKYASFQSIVSLNRRTKDGKIKRRTANGIIEEDNPAGPALTDQEINVLSSEEVRMALDLEQKIVSECLKIYRERNKPAQKDLRKSKRKTSAPLQPPISNTKIKVSA
jgi:hypothetical protein